MSKYEALCKKYRNRYLQLKGGVTPEELATKKNSLKSTSEELKKLETEKEKFWKSNISEQLKKEKQLNPIPIGNQQSCNMTKLEDTEKPTFKFPSDEDNTRVCEKEQPEKRTNWIVSELYALETAIINFIKEFECCYNDFLKISKDKEFLDHFKILVDDLKKKFNTKIDFGNSKFVISYINSIKCIKEYKYDPIKYYVKTFQSIIHTCLDYWNLFGILYSSKFEKYAKTDLKRSLQDQSCNNVSLKKDLKHVLNKQCCDQISFQSFKGLYIKSHRIFDLLNTIATKSCDNPMFQYILKEDMAFILKIENDVQSIYPYVENIQK